MTMLVRQLRRNSSICVIDLMNPTHLRGYVFMCKLNIRIRKVVKRIVHSPIRQFYTFDSFCTMLEHTHDFAKVCKFGT